MRAPLLVRTSSFYFPIARALRHTSALLRYNARSLCHRYDRAQFTIHFLKEIKKLFLKHCWVARASPHFSRVLKNSCVLLLLNNTLGVFFISLLNFALARRIEAENRKKKKKLAPELTVRTWNSWATDVGYLLIIYPKLTRPQRETQIPKS